jgi:hypothetical protein
MDSAVFPITILPFDATTLWLNMPHDIPTIETIKKLPWRQWSKQEKCRFIPNGRASADHLIQYFGPERVIDRTGEQQYSPKPLSQGSINPIDPDTQGCGLPTHADTIRYSIVPGKAISKQTIDKVYNNACQKTGVDYQGGIHSLRHSFDTHLLELGGCTCKDTKPALKDKPE